MSIIGVGRYRKQKYYSFCSICKESLNIAEDQVKGYHISCKRKQDIEQQKEN